MHSKKPLVGLRAALPIFIVILFATSAYPATEKIVHDFSDNGSDGYYPYNSLIFDKTGNLYGTTVFGGTNGSGTVVELTPKGGGLWTETVLHNFGSGADGTYPYGNLIFDASGNLYGTTQTGGTAGVGTVFEMTPTTKGVWKEKVLHSFALNGKDAATPLAGVIFDTSGNLYGTSELGGIYDSGAVFELSPKAGGGWTEKVLHSFDPNGKDGTFPNAGVIVNGSGNLFGTTLEGGTAGLGTAFELSPKAGGGWKETVLHSFSSNGKDGYLVFAGLIFDGAGNLYGATSVGGTKSGGTVFELTPKAGGGWKEEILYNFAYAQGSDPFGRLIFDASGNLYGTMGTGGVYAEGTVFKLTLEGSGKWAQTVLHNFNDDGTDGYDPIGGLIFDASGNLYGTTYHGGTSTSCSDGCGTVFEIKL
jgi:uncharacterized repeat protein (TIGR03803 family)